MYYHCGLLKECDFSGIFVELFAQKMEMAGEKSGKNKLYKLKLS